MKKLLVCMVVLLFVQNSFSQKEMDMATKFPCVGCSNIDRQYYKNPNANLESLKAVKYERLEQIFNDIIQNSGIEFNYPQAACQQRTQYLSMLLTKKYKLEHFRVWLFAPIDLDATKKEQLEIEDKNGLAENNQINWKYHVAPAVKIKDTIYVIDPSLNSKKPMILADWFALIGNHKISSYSFLASEFYFFNRQFNNGNLTDVLRGDFYKYEGNAKDKLLVEKGLAVNDTAIRIYKKYLFALKNSSKESDKQKFNELKKVFGNYDNLSKFLLDDPNRSYYTSYSELYAKHNELFNEAIKIYLERLIFWTERTNELLSMN